MLTVCIPTLNRYDKLEELILSLLSGSLIPNRIVVIDNGNNMPDTIKELCKDKTELFIYTPSHNLGVAASWNWFIETEKNALLITNDDVTFSKDDYKAFVDAYNNNSSEFYFTDNLTGLNMFSCFVITPECVNKVGLFDESFWPAYFEDNDYARRMNMANIVSSAVKTNMGHFGSATLAAYSPAEREKHGYQFRSNRSCYIAKWGGEPGQETFNSPFGN